MRNVEKIIVLLLLIAAISIPACSQKEVTAAPEKTAEASAVVGAVKLPSGLSYTDIVKGTGDAPTSGKGVSVRYTGWLTDGTKFDSTEGKGAPFSFTIGRGEVIPGWDEGVMSMKVGGKRKLVIPPQLGYGSSGAGGVIPPNATLIFDVELVSVEK
ncbi:FKBP-type peptidyl-prolyl cis-trans isomerase [Geomonas sp.]|uniref:FKBP-type peptidyl-prolyl cis-trans isomerase n=1 Tax=Geomonas sp. TaxID=2651584 RepID=UPI002B4985E2|nr:FKBP-type peptidyl-prolyl cis-trans isomerase [Geomonas sp.]HJV35541.1 FKBP-type peptidyl-prolyl cis-trans isomerase [Geomonas sp.]